ncbi:MAG TPA: DinB family protein [Vicinamibacterales bacterium]|nr:DinB family protein [Vicinamibacterales bacterium]
MLTVPRPNHDEFAPFYSAYVARIGTDVDSIQQLVSQRETVVGLLATVAETQAAFRYAPDKWSIKDVVGHMGDTERVFGYSGLRALMRRRCLDSMRTRTCGRLALIADY